MRVYTEKYIQNKIKEALVSLGYSVIVFSPAPGVPTGTLDILFFKGNIYGWCECKKTEDSPFRPLQPENIAKYKKWGIPVWVAHSGNFKQVIEEMRSML